MMRDSPKRDNILAAMSAIYQSEAKTMMVENLEDTRIPSEKRGH